MAHKTVDTIILGAGPAGLAAGKCLSEANVPILLLERSWAVGGLMRSINRNDFCVDVGRKELYSRIPEVDVFWSELLKEDYRPYTHRAGILYHGNILEMTFAHRGLFHGMPKLLAAKCIADYVWFKIKSGLSTPSNYQDFRYRKYGPKFCQIFNQGYQEKFRGSKWAELPAQELPGNQSRKLSQVLKNKINQNLGQNISRPHWRHPARGSGQISHVLEQNILEAGGRFQLNTKVKDIRTSNGRIASVTVETETGNVIYHPKNVISSIPIDFLGHLVLKDQSCLDDQTAQKQAPRSVVLVYLFLDEPPTFPHTWLNVSCPNMRSGRITNYAAFNGEMVPKNKTCLCVEYFCTGADKLLELSRQQLVALTLAECHSAGLVNLEKCFDEFVLKLPGIDPSACWQDWKNDSKRDLTLALNQFENLYNVNRAGTDVATYAGLMAAQAILSDQRHDFDSLTDPARYPPTASW